MENTANNTEVSDEYEDSSRIGSWSFDEKQLFVKALSNGPPYRLENGKINWSEVCNFIETKTLIQVKEFAKYIHALENGHIYPEFSKKAAIDVWRDAAEKTTRSDDDVVNVCIPQVLTVAALEPTNSSSSSQPRADTSTSSEQSNVIDPPNYSNIYNFLSAATRGNESPDISASESAVVLDLLEDLILTLSKSETLIQREFLHKQYRKLHRLMDNTDSLERPKEKRKKLNSINPFGVSFEVLDFKRFQDSKNPEDTNKKK